MRSFRVLPLIVLFAAACTGAAEEQDGLTKDEARARGGKADDGYDYCEIYGWYGDGICDVFCANPDPDCGIEYCYSDGDCESHQECNADEVCLSPCSGDEVCPAVCAGTCVDKPAAFCGGIAGIMCPDGQYCDFAADAGCGFADAGGVCKDKPDFCYELYAPVCGCNGETYSNDCFAAAAGVSVKSLGTCDDPTPTASCEGACGGAAPGNVCYCDAACTGYGDCCDDYESLCTTDDRTPASGACVRNSNDECTTDADCTSGGCGGELCYNPAGGGGFSTCDCTAPSGPACGCVAGKCTWYE